MFRTAHLNVAVSHPVEFVWRAVAGCLNIALKTAQGTGTAAAGNICNAP